MNKPRFPAANVITMTDNGNLSIDPVESLVDIYTNGKKQSQEVPMTPSRIDGLTSQPINAVPSSFSGEMKVTPEQLAQYKNEINMDTANTMVYINLGDTEGYRREFYNHASINGTPESPCIVLAFKERSPGYFPPLRQPDVHEPLKIKISGDDTVYSVYSIDLIVTFMGHTLIILPIAG